MLDNYLEQNTKHSSTQDKKRYIQPENNGLESSCEKINKKCGDVPKNMMKKKSRKKPREQLNARRRRRTIRKRFVSEGAWYDIPLNPPL